MFRDALKALPLVLVAFLLMNCGTAGQQSVRPDRATKADSLQEKVQRLQRNINNLEEDSERIQSEQKGAQFDLQNSDAVADKLVELENRLALLEERVDFIDSTKFNLMTRFERLENRVQATPTSPLQAQQQPSGAAMSESEYQAAYQRAYNLYQNRNYERAMAGFNQVIQARPNGDLSDNAQYWIGECYYALQNYTRAIVEFEKVFTFTESNKDDDAQLKLGLCYLNLGQRQKAREEFRRLVDFYPTSEYKDKAVEYINQL